MTRLHGSGRAGPGRVALALAAVLALSSALTGSAAAEPPESSGIVVRVVAPGIVLFPDPENGLAVHVNISREDFCDSGAPAEDLEFQFVDTPSSAQLLLIKGSDLPAYLHRFDGDMPAGPCAEAIDDEPAFVGTVDLVYNDNETCPCQNARTNSFGLRGGGTVTNADDDGAWHYAWHWRLLIDKNDVFGVATESYRLHPLGR